MNVLPNTISAREAFLHYVSLSYELTEELRAIRRLVLCALSGTLAFGVYDRSDLENANEGCV